MTNWEFTGETKTEFGIILRRIRAVRDLPKQGVRAGDIGGWIERESNLEGNAWVSGNAWVYGNARVSGNAWVHGNAWVGGDARVYGDAWVHGNAQVSGNAWVGGDARVYGDAWVHGNAQVYGNARVYGNAQVYGNARVYGNAQVYGKTRIEFSSEIVVVSGFHFVITLVIGYAVIGCMRKKYSEWYGMSETEAEAVGLPKDQFQKVRKTLKLLRPRRVRQVVA